MKSNIAAKSFSLVMAIMGTALPVMVRTLWSAKVRNVLVRLKDYEKSSFNVAAVFGGNIGFFILLQ